VKLDTCSYGQSSPTSSWLKPECIMSSSSAPILVTHVRDEMFFATFVVNLTKAD
jgi:hypothetical protein